MSSTDPITKIFFITAKEHLSSSQTITKVVACTQRGHDADLYESSWRNRGKRYLCFEKDPISNHVVTDLLIIRDNEVVPDGFHGAFLTEDTDEKALKKHILCVKSEEKIKADKAITDIMLINQVSKGEKAAQNYFTISHEVNDINISFRVDKISQPTPTVIPQPLSNPKLKEVHLQAGDNGSNFNSSSNNGRKKLTFTRSASIAISPVTAIDGVPFEINPKYNANTMSNDPILSSIPVLSMADINAKYITHTFQYENEIIEKYMDCSKTNRF